MRVVCFGVNTRIRCPSGHVPVQDIKPGQAVTTADGSTVRVADVVRHRNVATAMVHIPVNALGPRQPYKTLRVTPGHLIRVSNYGGITAGRWAALHCPSALQPIARVDLYHVYVRPHTFLNADGVAAESCAQTDKEFASRRHLFA